MLGCLLVCGGSEPHLRKRVQLSLRPPRCRTIEPCVPFPGQSHAAALSIQWCHIHLHAAPPSSFPCTTHLLSSAPSQAGVTSWFVGSVHPPGQCADQSQGKVKAWRHRHMLPALWCWGSLGRPWRGLDCERTRLSLCDWAVFSLCLCAPSRRVHVAWLKGVAVLIACVGLLPIAFMSQALNVAFDAVGECTAWQTCLGLVLGLGLEFGSGVGSGLG